MNAVGDAGRARAYQVFADALDYQAGVREEFLARECDGDGAFRAEVDALILLATADSAATTSLLAAPQTQREDLVGQQYGNFRLTACSGEGGMGVVYRAERVDGVAQSVAVKLISTTVGHSAQALSVRDIVGLLV